MAKEKNPAAVEMARKRAESLTPERRSEIARNAVNERWKPKRRCEIASRAARARRAKVE
jgi:hypothetical protein